MAEAGQTFGSFLRVRRAARRVSLRRLAALSGVSARTLSYWEAGARAPRVPEMEAALAALAVSPEERLRVMALVDAPRAVRAVRRASDHQEGALGPTPSMGDLLRALRHRRRLRLEDVSRTLGISTGTVSRWEQCKVTPPEDRLNALLAILRPHPQERAALARRSSLVVPSLSEVAGSVERLREAFAEFASAIYGCMEDALHDLRFLTFTSQAWPFAARGAAGRSLLAEIHARHACYLAGFHRYAEAGRRADRALDLMEDPRAPEPFMLRAAVVRAEAAVFRRASPAPRRGLEILEAWRDLPEHWDCRAWLEADLAAFTALHGDMDEGIRLGVAACRIAEESGNADNLRLRRLDLARILTRAGRAEAGIPLTDPLAKDTAFRRADVRLLLAEEYLSLGDAESARRHTDEAEADITAFHLAHLDDRRAAIRRALAEGAGRGAPGPL